MNKKLSQTRIETLIEKLLSNDGQLSMLLLEAKLLLIDTDEHQIVAYLENELNGYNGEDLPEYRKIKGKLMGVFVDNYGRKHPSVELQTHNLINTIGFDLSIVLVIDSISFLEENLKNLDDSTVSRPLSNSMIPTLNEWAQASDPRYRLISAHHSFGRSQLQFVLTSVRQELITKLASIKFTPPTSVSSTDSIAIVASKATVFVTYAWGDKHHNELVASFVNFLRDQGYNAFMDIQKTQEETAINFNQMMLNGLYNSDKVIVVLSTEYKRRADTDKGGVAMEYQIIVEDIKTHPNKYIFVSFDIVDSDSLEAISPLGLKGRQVVDLKAEQDNNDFKNLYAKLQSKDLVSFNAVGDKVDEVVAIKPKPFRL